MRSVPVARGAGEVSPEILVRLVLWAILLGVPMVLLFLFGLWNGRRGASWSLLAVRSCLGSLLLSWTYMQMADTHTGLVSDHVRNCAGRQL